MQEAIKNRRSIRKYKDTPVSRQQPIYNRCGAYLELLENDYDYILIDCIRKPKVEQLKKIADGLEISVIEFLDIEIENEADLIAMLKKISPFFKWDGLLHVLEGEKFL